jgi:hypothetical protein
MWDIKTCCFFRIDKEKMNVFGFRYSTGRELIQKSNQFHYCQFYFHVNRMLNLGEILHFTTPCKSPATGQWDNYLT